MRLCLMKCQYMYEVNLRRKEVLTHLQLEHPVLTLGLLFLPRFCLASSPGAGVEVDVAELPVGESSGEGLPEIMAKIVESFNTSSQGLAQTRAQ